VEREPVVSVENGGAITVPGNGGGISVFGNSSADVSLDQSADGFGATVAFRGDSRLQYRLKFGVVRDFELAFSSGSQTNRLRNARDGLTYGFDVSGDLSIDTPVTPAIAWTVGVDRTEVELDELLGDTADRVNLKSDQVRWWGAVRIGKRWKWALPYAGLEVERMSTRLSDQDSVARVGGRKDGALPLVGLSLLPSTQENFLVEASFGQGTSVTASATISF
jgi:hypothetical protein